MLIKRYICSMEKKMKRKKITFKPYNVNQPQLIPMDYDSLIPKDHPVRLINDIVEQLDLSCLRRTYKGGGQSGYDPRMLLKVLIYAYMSNIYSSRRIANALRENIYFMWLSGNSYPGFRTINRFRGERLRGRIFNIFGNIVMLLVEKGVVELKRHYLDGTKLEANANRYSFIWRKNTKRYKQNVTQAILEIIEEIDKHIENDKLIPRNQQYQTISSDELSNLVSEINKKIEKADVAEAEKKIVKKKIKCSEEEAPAKP